MNTPLLLELHRAAGARLREDPAEVLTFGDVPAEYAAATQGAALLDATTLGAVEARGLDAVDFLHRITANDVRGLAAGRVARNLLLSSKGKVLFDFETERGAEGLRLVLAAARAPALADALELYHFTEKVAFEVTSERLAPLEVVGPRAAEVVRAVSGLATEPAPGTWTAARFEGAALSVTATGVAGSPGFRLDAGPERAAALWRALAAAGARPIGVVAREILRIEACCAAWGADVDEQVYPQEARLERAFSLTKGCYTGQEVVAKIDTYGGLNKRLTALRVAHDDPVPRGTRLHRLDDGQWRDLGVVTSWAYSFVLDTGLVLAFVKRRHQGVGTEFRLGDGPATATVVPMPVRPGALSVTGEFESATGGA
ncbi:MAG: aminomethyltransferase family protein [Planctomycetes bacterium]|nr:aminomethyltransferase family protein [Planctomycetota bacterium]